MRTRFKVKFMAVPPEMDELKKAQRAWFLPAKFDGKN
jgi:uncharacterized protein YecT (DUF1311 family)